MSCHLVILLCLSIYIYPSLSLSLSLSHPPHLTSIYCMSSCHVIVSYIYTKLIRQTLDNIYVNNKNYIMYKITKTPSSSEFFPIYLVTSCNCPDGTFTRIHFQSYDRTKCVSFINEIEDNSPDIEPVFLMESNGYV